MNKQGLVLDKVVLLGRTLDEYVRFFGLDPAALRGQASAKLLDSYELERRPVALRNTRFAAGFADSVGLYVPSPAIETVLDTAIITAPDKRDRRLMRKLDAVAGRILPKERAVAAKRVTVKKAKKRK